MSRVPKGSSFYPGDRVFCTPQSQVSMKPLRKKTFHHFQESIFFSQETDSFMLFQQVMVCVRSRCVVAAVITQHRGMKSNLDGQALGRWWLQVKGDCGNEKWRVSQGVQPHATCPFLLSQLTVSYRYKYNMHVEGDVLCLRYGICLLIASVVKPPQLAQVHPGPSPSLFALGSL